MSLSEQLDEFCRAAYSGIWIVSHEKVDAINDLATLCRENDWSMATWNIASGVSIGGQAAEDTASDPLSAIRSTAALSDGEKTTLVVLEDFHHYLGSPEIIATLGQQVLLGKQRRTVFVILGPVVKLPVELEKLFVVVDHALPDRDQLRSIAGEIATEDGELPEGEAMERVLDAASGLTRLESENVFALSLVRHSRLEPQTLWSQKSQMLAKAGTLKLYEGDANFDSLGGLASLKAFTRRALSRSSSSGVRARGVMLLSPPGCGKSEFCKALGREVDRPVLQLDVGSLLGSLVGQSEERTRQALAIVDAMAPCVLMIDEVEKAFAGVGSGGNDGGVSARMFGAVLSWLNDHESDVFVVCTSNDASRLPPEFSRSERFDGTFFVDLPGPDEKAAIWSMYLERYGLDESQKLPDDESWTGAEIKSAARLSKLLDVPVIQSAQNVVPVSVTAAESISALRQWASGRCLDANTPGIYQCTAKRKTARRRVSHSDPSNN